MIWNELEVTKRGVYTIQQLINKHEITLHSLLVKLPKIPFPQRHESVQKLKHQRCIRIALRDRHQVDILMLHMTKSRASQRQDRTPNRRIANNLDAKDIREAWTTVVAEGAKDEVFAFLVEDEDAGEHRDESAR